MPWSFCHTSSRFESPKGDPVYRFVETLLLQSQGPATNGTDCRDRSRDWFRLEVKPNEHSTTLANCLDVMSFCTSSKRESVTGLLPTSDTINKNRRTSPYPVGPCLFRKICWFAVSFVDIFIPILLKKSSNELSLTVVRSRTAARTVFGTASRALHIGISVDASYFNMWYSEYLEPAPQQLALPQF